MANGTTADSAEESAEPGGTTNAANGFRARAAAAWYATPIGRWWDERQINARVHAWWEGYEFQPSAPKAKPAAKSSKGEPSLAPTVRGWPVPRLEVVQALFGEGMLSPAQPEQLVKIINPLGLNEKMTVIEVGAGLGGLARVVAAETGAYVTAFESDPLLAKLGMELSTKHGVARKAVIKQAAATAFDARPKSVDAVLAKESLFTIEDKPTLFAAIRKALKPGGQFMLSDYMLAGDSQGPATAAWSADEPVAPHLMPIAKTRAALEGLGLQVRVVEDVTAEFRSAALAAFATLADRIKSGEISEGMRPWALCEGDLWSRRLTLLASGEVKMIRLYARLPAVKELT
ncbi:MAG TPA: class I SAM-dependent methyltransferase [Candidatus Cybelea sp.]|nr:class I SAM-dependent methyltransferase [Candidatus Cybelea sp.]